MQRRPVANLDWCHAPPVISEAPTAVTARVPRPCGYGAHHCLAETTAYGRQTESEIPYRTRLLNRHIVIECACGALKCAALRGRAAAVVERMVASSGIPER